MQRKPLLIIGAVVVAFLAVIGVVLYLLYPKNYGDVVVIDRVEYGMSPSEIEKILGEPQQKQDYASDGAATLWYHYQMKLHGEMADVTLAFVTAKGSKTLYEVCLEYNELENDLDAEQLIQMLSQKITEAYQNEKGFSAQNNGTTHVIGTNQGAEGVQCSIAKKDRKVKVVCTNSF